MRKSHHNCFLLPPPSSSVLYSPHLSQRSSRPSMDQTLKTFFFHIIYLQFEVKHPIILSVFHVTPPSAFAPSLIGSNPQITLARFVTSSIFTLKNPITPPPLCIPRCSSLGDHLIPHFANREHSSSAGVWGPHRLKSAERR